MKHTPCLGADYMASFIPGWNFSPVSRAVISSRPSEQISLKRRLRLHGETFSSGWDFQPGLWSRAVNFSPGWNSEKPHVIASSFIHHYLCIIIYTYQLYFRVFFLNSKSSINLSYENYFYLHDIEAQCFVRINALHLASLWKEAKNCCARWWVLMLRDIYRHASMEKNKFSARYFIK